MGNGSSSSCDHPDLSKVKAVEFGDSTDKDIGYKWYGFHVLSAYCKTTMPPPLNTQVQTYQKVLNIPMIICTALGGLLLLYLMYKIMIKNSETGVLRVDQ